jgi:hypothetical protein
VFINTEPAPFPTLSPWQLVIEKNADHNFLTYNSYIDCSTIIEANLQWLESDLRRTPDIYRGDVNENIMTQILALVATSPVIKKLLLKRYGLETPILAAP